MDDDDLLARVQVRGRFHGRNESRRAVRAVVEALGEFLSPRSFRLLADQLPEDVRRRPGKPTLPKPTLPVRTMTARAFLARIGRQLLVDGPGAAFTARIVLEELNAGRRVIRPAAFAHLVAPDLPPLLRAHPPADRLAPPRRIIRVPATASRPATRPAAPAPPSLPAAPAPPSLPAAIAHPAAAAPDREVAAVSPRGR